MPIPAPKQEAMLDSNRFGWICVIFVIFNLISLSIVLPDLGADDGYDSDGNHFSPRGGGSREFLQVCFLYVFLKATILKCLTFFFFVGIFYWIIFC
jgi:hypothetical protein